MCVELPYIYPYSYVSSIVLGEADLASLAMEEGDQFIILASDGLWDVMTSEEAVAFVHNVMSAHVGALREGGNGTVDASERPGTHRRT